jgi:predicted metal-dependent peptidase
MDGTPGETDINGTEWKIAAVQAAEAARAMGKLPGSLARFIDEMVAPKVDWRAMLQRFITETSKNDYSWMRPNRRFLQQGMFLPTLYSESMGEIVVAIDTSGSIDQHTLNAFGAEIRAITGSVRPAKTTVIYCDAEVNHVDEFGPNDDLKFAMHGGGGTRFEPPFQYVEEHSITPVCFVYLTDLYGSFGAAPSYPVMWCATTDVIAPWGETVQIES